MLLWTLLVDMQVPASCKEGREEWKKEQLGSIAPPGRARRKRRGHFAAWGATGEGKLCHRFLILMSSNLAAGGLLHLHLLG